MSCFFVVRLFLVATLLFLTAVFRRTFAFDFDIFIPGMFCMSWPCATTMRIDASISPMITTAINPDLPMKAQRFDLFIVSPLERTRITKRKADETAHTRRRTSARPINDDSLRELDSENADQKVAGERIARWAMLQRHDWNYKSGRQCDYKVCRWRVSLSQSPRLINCNNGSGP